jgi:hypothetical protein
MADLARKQHVLYVSQQRTLLLVRGAVLQERSVFYRYARLL